MFMRKKLQENCAIVFKKEIALCFYFCFKISFRQLTVQLSTMPWTLLQRQEDKVLETKSLEVWRQRPPRKEEDGADAAKSKKAWRELLMTTRLKQSISVKKQPRPSEYSEAFADAAVEVESFPTKTKTRTKETDSFSNLNDGDKDKTKKLIYFPAAPCWPPCLASISTPV